MIPKPFDAVEKADIDELITRAVPERKRMEYKQSLPLSQDEEKKEFLGDVVSFANASGGDILYGIEDERDPQTRQPTGVPKIAHGVASTNPGADTLRLQNMIVDGIRPRISGILLKLIDGFPKGPVLLLRIPQSYTAPHMVWFKQWSRFFTRHSSGRSIMDVDEIRSAFVLSESLPEKVRSFRTHRLNQLQSPELFDAPLELNAGPKVVLHVLPVRAFSASPPIEVAKLASDPRLLPLLERSTSVYRHNLDGFLTYELDEKTNKYSSYTQMFRTGAVEVADFNMLRFTPERHAIYGDQIEPSLAKALRTILDTLDGLGVEPPMFVMLTLTQVKNNYIVSMRTQQRGRFPIDRHTLYLPECVVDDPKREASEILRPAFDALWQSGGWPSCPHFDEEGRYSCG